MDFTLIKPEDLLELKNADEMDETLLKSIQDEYFKGVAVYSFIMFLFAAVFVALYMFDVIPQPPLIPLSKALSDGVTVSDIVLTVLVVLVAVCLTVMVYQIVRCVYFFIVFAKIKKQKFCWGEGVLKGRRMKWPGTWGRKRSYYSVDDRYFAETMFSPRYRKGTEVYFLYFPGFCESFHFGGVVIRR